MKEIKEFIQELCDCAKPSANGSVVALEDATRIVAHAFAAGMNFQDHEIKCKHKFRHFEKEDIDKVADFKFIPNPANGGWDGNDGIVHNPDCKCNKKIKSTTQY